MKQVLIYFLLLIAVAGFGQNKKLIDEAATNETKALFRNLDKLSQSHILFGTNMQRNTVMAGRVMQTDRM